MDRNESVLAYYSPSPVALRKESVDRNTQNRHPLTKPLGVALRKESVDRNVWALQS